jgi:hypothetical protein
MHVACVCVCVHVVEHSSVVLSTDLESLSLAFNRMKNESHENDTIECLDRLKILDLSNNKLRTVPPAIFVRYCRQLHDGCQHCQHSVLVHRGLVIVRMCCFVLRRCHR